MTDRRLLPVLGVGALLLLAMALSAFGNPAIEALPVELRPVASGSARPVEPAEAAEDGQPAPSGSQAPTTLPGGVLLAGGAVAVLVFLVGLGWWYVRGRRSVRVIRIKPVVRAPAPTDVRRLRAAIDEGLTALDEGDADPRRAVIVCWVRLERAAASAGTVREPGETSTDLVARLLAARDVSAALLAALAARYREARFAPHTGRFLLRVSFGYPSPEEEWQVLQRRMARRREEVVLDPVIDAGSLLAVQAALEDVCVEDSVGRYMVDVVAATREHPQVLVGASPRGSLALLLLSRAVAARSGRDFVVPEDVKHVAVAALAHRITLRPEMWLRRVDAGEVVASVLEHVAVPASGALPVTRISVPRG